MQPRTISAWCDRCEMLVPIGHECEVFNVLVYGVVGDQVTDNAAAVKRLQDVIANIDAVPKIEAQTDCLDD